KGRNPRSVAGPADASANPPPRSRVRAPHTIRGPLGGTLHDPGRESGPQPIDCVSGAPPVSLADLGIREPPAGLRRLDRRQPAAFAEKDVACVATESDVDCRHPWRLPPAARTPSDVRRLPPGVPARRRWA